MSATSGRPSPSKSPGAPCGRACGTNGVKPGALATAAQSVPPRMSTPVARYGYRVCIEVSQCPRPEALANAWVNIPPSRLASRAFSRRLTLELPRDRDEADRCHRHDDREQSEIGSGLQSFLVEGREDQADRIADEDHHVECGGHDALRPRNALPVRELQPDRADAELGQSDDEGCEDHPP